MFCCVLLCFVVFCYVLSCSVVLCCVFLCLISRIFVECAPIQLTSVNFIHQNTRTRHALPPSISHFIRMPAFPSLRQLVYDHKEQTTGMWVHMAMGRVDG